MSLEQLSAGANVGGVTVVREAFVTGAIVRFAEQLSAEQMSAEQLSAEQLSAEQMSAEQMSAEHMSAKQMSAGYFNICFYLYLAKDTTWASTITVWWYEFVFASEES